MDRHMPLRSDLQQRQASNTWDPFQCTRPKLPIPGAVQHGILGSTHARRPYHNPDCHHRIPCGRTARPQRPFPRRLRPPEIHRARGHHILAEAQRSDATRHGLNARLLHQGAARRFARTGDEGQLHRARHRRDRRPSRRRQARVAQRALLVHLPGQRGDPV